MQREIVYDTLEAFINGLKGLSIDKIAFGETSEMRPVEVEANLLSVVSVNEVELLAYKDSVIHKCRLRDIDRDSLFGRLVNDGFDVTRRNRNIT